MTTYNDDYQSPVEIINGEKFVRYQPGSSILRSRRQELGFTQQEVADWSEINLRQYTRLENGEREMTNVSMRIGLAICSVLLLDPHRFV